MKKVFLSLALVAAMSVSFVSCKEKAEEGTEVEAAMDAAEEATEDAVEAAENAVEATEDAVETTEEAAADAVETPAAE